MVSLIYMFADLKKSLKIVLVKENRLNFKQIKKFGIIFLVNSRTAIAGAIIGLLLVFYDSKKSIGFLSVFRTRRGVLVFSRFFLQEVDLFTRHFT